MSENAVIAKAVYREAPATASMHAMPRFGASDDFSDLFRSKEAAKDYIVGLLFAGLFLFALFFAWSVCLLVFKCLGKRKVGFLSGAAFEKPKDPSAKCNRPFVSRLVFLNATLLLITFSVLFVTQGLTNLKSTVVTVADSVRNVNEIMGEVQGLMTRVQLIGSNATNVANTFVSRLDNGGQECIENELAPNNPNVVATIQNIRAKIQELKDFRPSEFDEFQNTTEYLATTSSDIEKETENIQIGDWQSLIILIPYIIVPLFLLAAVGFAWFDVDVPVLRCVTSYVVLPLFIIMVVFSYLFSSIIAIVAASNADFCSGGATQTPDGTVYAILKAQGFSSDDLVLKTASWYIGQCGSSEDPFDFMDIYDQQLQEASSDVGQLTLQLETSANNAATELCAADAEIMTGLSRTLNTNMVELAKLVEDSLDLMSCRNMVILYTLPVYEGTCTYSVTGFAWAFGAFAAVGGLGLVMIMLRSAWQIDVDPPDAMDGAFDLKDVNKTGDEEDYEEAGAYGYSPGKSEDGEDKNDEEQEQPAAGGGGAYGALEDDSQEYGDGGESGGLETQTQKEDDFFSQRAEGKGSGEMY